jgi:hypothetical protein
MIFNRNAVASIAPGNPTGANPLRLQNRSLSFPKGSRSCNPGLAKVTAARLDAQAKKVTHVDAFAC